MKMNQEGTLEFRLARFLFQCRITPHSTTGIPPTELMINCKMRSRLDLVYPDVEAKVQQKQSSQTQHHDTHTKAHQFTVGGNVYVRDFKHNGKNFKHNPKDDWMSAVVVEMTGPLSYKVKFRNGNIIRRHVDHIRKRYFVDFTIPNFLSDCDRFLKHESTNSEPNESTQTDEIRM